jgi:Terminase RNaseH-like domain/Terminase large subunit, T4likevirus-type, N-terminal
MTIDDVEHYSDDDKKTTIASYPAHELEARTKGIPALGSGRIFPIEESKIAIDHRDFPPHWPRIGGMDFGWDHPFAAVELVWDRGADVVYVSKTHRLKEASPVIHAAALRAWGKELPWAWPRDGRRETLEGAGIALAKQYKDQGLNMLSEHAQFEDKSVSVEAGLMDMGSTTATANSGALVPANRAEYFITTPGQMFSFISTSTSSGYVVVSEMT